MGIDGTLIFLLDLHMSDIFPGEQIEQHINHKIADLVLPNDVEFKLTNVNLTFYEVNFKKNTVAVIVKCRVLRSVSKHATTIIVTTPVKVVDKEPDSPAAISIPFATLPKLQVSAADAVNEMVKNIPIPEEKIAVTTAKDIEFLTLPDTGGLPRITATIETDDKVCKHTFDCTTWFEIATDKELEELAGDGWGHEYSADAIARFCEEHDPKLKNVFDHLDSLPKDKKNPVGFEVEVNADLAREWVINHRPHMTEILGQIEDNMAEEKAKEELLD